MLNFEEKPVSTEIRNISSKFRVLTANLNLYKQSMYFECCTVQNNVRIECTKAAISRSTFQNANYIIIFILFPFTKFLNY
jgi:hypothetical protein